MQKTKAVPWGGFCFLGRAGSSRYKCRGTSAFRYRNGNFTSGSQTLDEDYCSEDEFCLTYYEFYCSEGEFCFTDGEFLYSEDEF